MYKVAVFVGSLRKESINKKLALALMGLGNDLFSFTLVDLADVPMLNQDLEQNLPAPVQRMKEAIRAADAVLFVTPEHNRSMPALMKNTLDWGSRPMKDNAWGGKPAAIAGASPGHVGTAAAQSHLRSVLTVLGMAVISQPEVYLSVQPEFFTDQGAVANETTQKFLRRFLERFSAWIEKTV